MQLLLCIVFTLGGCLYSFPLFIFFLHNALQLRCAQASNEKSEEATAQMQAAALDLPASAWVGSALTTGLVVVVLLLAAGSFLVEVEPFVESPVF